MIDLHFAEVERRKRSGKIDDVFDDESLKGMLFDLFVAGTDTTSTALLWFLMYMARHPDTQRKVCKNNVSMKIKNLYENG